MCAQLAQDALNDELELLSAVALIAGTRCSIPLSCRDGESEEQDRGGNLCVFDAASVQDRDIILSEEGRMCTFRSGCDGSAFVGEVLQAGSGDHYLEFKVLKVDGEFSFVGCAVATFDTSHVIGSGKGSWGWANDGDLQSEGSWCGDSGLSTFKSGDSIGLRVDMDAHTLRFTKNGKLLSKTVSMRFVCLCRVLGLQRNTCISCTVKEALI